MCAYTGGEVGEVSCLRTPPQCDPVGFKLLPSGYNTFCSTISAPANPETVLTIPIVATIEFLPSLHLSVTLQSFRVSPTRSSLCHCPPDRVAVSERQQWVEPRHLETDTCCFSVSERPWAEWPALWINTGCGLTQMLEPSVNILQYVWTNYSQFTQRRQISSCWILGVFWRVCIWRLVLISFINVAKNEMLFYCSS